MNTPVNFEIGKLLKDNKQNISRSKLMYASNGKLTDAIYDFDDWCFAPTIAEVLMWFYEKHNIWIYVERNDNGEFQWFVNSDMGMLEYKTPTQAYSEAIRYILINNIIKT